MDNLRPIHMKFVFQILPRKILRHHNMYQVIKTHDRSVGCRITWVEVSSVKYYTAVNDLWRSLKKNKYVANVYSTEYTCKVYTVEYKCKVYSTRVHCTVQL